MRAGLARGELQIGTWVTMARNPAILTLLQAAGLDFARIDMEHAATTIETIADFAVLARALDFPIAVRPPKANREWITRLLDVGVWNIHCPQVESAAHAREIVAASRYAPRGLRGNGGHSAATGFDSTISATDRRKFANEHLIIATAQKYGKTSAMLVASQEQAEQWKAAGALLLVYLSDVEVMLQGFKQAMGKIRG